MNSKVKLFLIKLFFISGFTVHACGSDDAKPQSQPVFETSPSNCDCNHCDQPAAE